MQHVIKKRLMLSIFLCSLFGLFLFSTVSAASAKAPVYVAIGDSITEGTGMDDPKDGFVTRFANKLKQDEPDLTYYNYGKSGHTVNDTINMIKSDPVLKKRLKEADYITITDGGNDALAFATKTEKKLTRQNYKKATRIPPVLKNKLVSDVMFSYFKRASTQKKLNVFYKQFSDDYNTLIKLLRELNPDALLLTQTIYNPVSGSDYGALADSVDLVLSSMNPIISEATYEEENAALLDTYQLFYKNAPRYIRVEKEDIHPTKLGHETIAEGLYQLVVNPAKETLAPIKNKTASVTEDVTTTQQSRSADTILLSTAALLYGGLLFLVLLFTIRKMW